MSYIKLSRSITKPYHVQKFKAIESSRFDIGNSNLMLDEYQE